MANRASVTHLNSIAAAALVAALTAVPSGSAHAQTSGGAHPVFRDGQAQVVEAFADTASWIREELWVESEFDTDGDGKPDRLHVAVVRQRQTETEGLKVPVLYASSPYYSGTSGPRENLWNVQQELGAQPTPRVHQPLPRRRTQPGINNSLVSDWVPRGFAVVHSEAPGTGLSQGCPTVGGPPESLAPKDVIDWLNGRAKAYRTVDGNEPVVASWSTGKVGMMGTSYNGTLPVAAASTGVEGLEAIIPVAPNTSYYMYYRSNGLVRHPGGWLGEDIDFLYDFINSGDPATRDYCNRTIRDGEMAAGRDRASGDYNAFWKARDLQQDLNGIRAATLMAHAFNDTNVKPEHSYSVLQVLKKNGVPYQAYYHQGGHGGDPPLELQNKWFTRYLYGVENGVENDPKAWIVREGADRLEPTPYADYPNPDASSVTLHPVAADVAAGGYVGVGGLSFSATGGQGRQTLVDNVSFGSDALANAEWTTHRLLYTTPELTEAVHMSGVPRITVRLASDRPAANLTVYLVSLPWTEGGRQPRGGVVNRGWADPQNHSSIEHGEPLAPGQFYDVTFNLLPDDEIVPAGQRLGLMIFSSDKDFTLWPRPGTELTVDLDGTSLDLPVVGGADALRRAFGGAAR